MHKPSTGLYTLGLFSALLFIWLAWLISKHAVIPFDLSLISWIQGYESPALTQVMKGFTWLGSAPVVFVLSCITLLVLYKVFHQRKELVLFAIVTAGTGILEAVLKRLFARPRPTLHRLIEESGYSFPSGHAMGAMAFYGILTYLLWNHIPTRRGRVWLLIVNSLLILFIGVSRIYLGVHFPSDILGGYAVSAFWLVLSIFFYHRWSQKNQHKRLRS